MSRQSLDAEIRAAQRAGLLPALPEPLTSYEEQLAEDLILALEDASSRPGTKGYYSGWGKKSDHASCVEVWGNGSARDARLLAAKLRQILPLLTQRAT